MMFDVVFWGDDVFDVFDYCFVIMFVDEVCDILECWFFVVVDYYRFC